MLEVKVGVAAVLGLTYALSGHGEHYNERKRDM